MLKILKSILFSNIILSYNSQYNSTERKQLVNLMCGGDMGQPGGGGHVKELGYVRIKHAFWDIRDMDVVVFIIDIRK